jgi:hypothetical protein
LIRQADVSRHENGILDLVDRFINRLLVVLFGFRVVRALGPDLLVDADVLHLDLLVRVEARHITGDRNLRLPFLQRQPRIVADEVAFDSRREPLGHARPRHLRRHLHTDARLHEVNGRRFRARQRDFEQPLTKSLAELR